MALERRIPARQAQRLSTSKLHQSKSQPSPSATAQDEIKPQPHANQPSGLLDSSDDENLVPLKLSALTQALLTCERDEFEHVCAMPDKRPPTSSTQPRTQIYTRRSALAASSSPVSNDHGDLPASGLQRETRRHIRSSSLHLPPARRLPPATVQGGPGSSPPPRKRVVRLKSTPGHEILHDGLGGSMSAPADRRGAESRNRWMKRESPFQTQAEVEEQQPKTPASSMRRGRISVDSSGQRIRSVTSPAVPTNGFGSNNDSSTPEDPAIARRTGATDDWGSVPRSNDSSKRDELELRRTTRLKRVARVSGSLLGRPARRGRRRQTDEDAEAQDEAPRAASQDLESQQAEDLEHAAIHQPATGLSTSNSHHSAALGTPVQTKHPVPAAIGKQDSAVCLSYPRAQRTESLNKSPHPDPIPLLATPSVQNKEVQAAAPDSFRPASTNLPDKGLSNPARPVSLDTGSVAPHQAPIVSERKALAVKSQDLPNRPAPPLPHPQMSAIETMTATRSTKKRHNLIKVNGRLYTRLECIGRGGSGKVYRVATASGVMLALKRVSLVGTDELTEKGLRREIELLQQLRGVERVIQLIDHEMNQEKQVLSVLMEVGQLDFNSVLRKRETGMELPRLDVTFVRHYWKEMLECVRAIHAKAVVHSDLKPANFVLAMGRLKLIDFGISNAIKTDMTINVYRETIAGTINYMSPESLMDSTQYAFAAMHNGHSYPPASNATKIVKVGKPSDVWSLGCILYQMVYGLPPFGKIPEHRSRVQAIVNWSHRIEYPATTEDGSRVPVALIQTIQRCLSRDQKDRPTCEALLSEDNDFLYPKEDNTAFSATVDGGFLPINEELIQRVIQSIVLRCKESLPTDDMSMAHWPGAYWEGLRKLVAQPTP